MRHLRMILFLLSVFLFSACGSIESPKPLSLHPQNPHYFLFRGEPAILIGSTEHYGAVMNLDFDYVLYLDELAANGLKCNPYFSGVYVEPAGALEYLKTLWLQLRNDLLLPGQGVLNTGMSNGGNKFDLTSGTRHIFTGLKTLLRKQAKEKLLSSWIFSPISMIQFNGSSPH